MDLKKSLVWMFVGSLVIGVLFNGMNILAYRVKDLYLSSTLVLSTLLMAFLMCALETLMYYSAKASPELGRLLILFVVLSVVTALILHKQCFVTDSQWLKRMISHHSTALTTSHQILTKTKNPRVSRLATDIITTQEREIKEMVDILNKIQRNTRFS